MFLVLFIVGIPSWIGLSLLVFTGRLKIRGSALFNSQKGMVLISNHPSLLEAGLLPILLFVNLIYGKTIFSTPDKANFFERSWFRPFRIACIPIFRGNGREELKSLDLIKEKIREGQIVILFAEGGRTFSVDNKHLISVNGERIRQFPQGLRRLFTNLDCSVGFVWCRGMDNVLKNSSKVSFSSFFLLKYWKRTEVVFGDVVDSADLPNAKNQVIPFLEKKLLKTSVK